MLGVAICDKGGAAYALTALHPVAGQAAPPAVGGGGPGQINLAAADGGRGQPGRIGRANRIGRRRRVVALATFE